MVEGCVRNAVISHLIDVIHRTIVSYVNAHVSPTSSDVRM